jgi:hypothetical protein
MKKSDLMLLRQNIVKATTPPPANKKEDLSDELSKLYDDGTDLTGGAKPISQSPADRQPPRDSQPPSGSQSEIPLPASQNDSQPESDSQTRGDSHTHDLLAGVRHVAGFLRLPNTVTDSVLRLLDTDEQSIYIQMYRLSHGNGKPSCFISLPKLAERTNIKMTSLKAALKRLESRGLISKSNLTLGYGKAQGIEYSVSSPDSQPQSDRQSRRGSQPQSASIKESTQKENTQTQGEPAAGVRVGSKFSIEECRRYANHLQSTGQGINNPGGYATTIKRTGEADEMIAAFLNPAETSAAVDVSQCPDCQGSGFYYPNGPGGGVAKCKHESLTQKGR